MVGLLLLAALALGPAYSAPPLLFVCAPDNDVYALLTLTGPAAPQRFDTIDQALASCGTGGGGSLYVLSQDYPTRAVSVTPAQWAVASACGLRVFVEFADQASVLAARGHDTSMLARRADCSFTVAADSYPAYADNYPATYALSDAQARCCAKADCGGVTCAPGATSSSCFLHKLGNIHSLTNETTYLKQGPVKRSYFARAVVNTTQLEAHGLPSMRLLMAQDAYVSFVADGAAGMGGLLVSAIVAGYDTAVYGLPPLAEQAVLLAPLEASSLCQSVNITECRAFSQDHQLQFEANEWSNIPYGCVYTAMFCWFNSNNVTPATHLSPGQSQVCAADSRARPTHGLFSTTKLSNLVTARHAPLSAWVSLWNFIFEQVGGGLRLLRYRARVGPSYEPSDALPADAAEQAVASALGHLSQAGTLFSPITGSAAEDIKARCAVVSFTRVTGPTGDASWTCLDEGFSSVINGDGSQDKSGLLDWQCRPLSDPVCSNTRTDDNAQASAGLAAGAALLGAKAERDYARIALEVVTYVYVHSQAQMAGVSKDDGSRGQVGWFTNSWDDDVAFYADNDGTVFLSAVLVAGLQNSSAFNRRFLDHLFGAARTTGVFGFRPARVERTDYVANGWQHYFEYRGGEFEPGAQPHYQANMWALLLWGSAETGKQRLFVDRVEESLRRLMNAYPTRWRWTEYLSEELAHMLLPLAWLYRVRPTATVLSWLRTIAFDLISHQRPCGAIGEFLGTEGLGDLPPPASNAAFGTGEGSLLQTEDDPVADLLYTQNFALMSLHEAWAATGDARLAAASDRLADFLVRTQAHVSSEGGPTRRLQGAWFRAFDVDKWEYWASNCDAGYGPWETENGWTIGWVSATLSLRALNSSFWEASMPVASAIRADQPLVDAVCADFLNASLCAVTVELIV